MQSTVTFYFVMLICFRQLQEGNLVQHGICDGSRITLLPNVETGLIVSILNHNLLSLSLFVFYVNCYYSRLSKLPQRLHVNLIILILFTINICLYWPNFHKFCFTIKSIKPHSHLTFSLFININRSNYGTLIKKVLCAKSIVHWTLG